MAAVFEHSLLCLMFLRHWWGLRLWPWNKASQSDDRVLYSPVKLTDPKGPDIKSWSIIIGQHLECVDWWYWHGTAIQSIIQPSQSFIAAFHACSVSESLARQQHPVCLRPLPAPQHITSAPHRTVKKAPRIVSSLPLVAGMLWDGMYACVPLTT